MEESELDKLCKVLALTNSDKSGEALAAFQSAKRLLLRNGLTFEDAIAQYYDDSGMPPQKQIASLKKQKAALKRQINELARELNENRKAVKDLLNQVWGLQEAKESAPSISGAKDETLPAEPQESIYENYRPNLSG